MVPKFLSDIRYEDVNIQVTLEGTRRLRVDSF